MTKKPAAVVHTLGSAHGREDAPLAIVILPGIGMSHRYSARLARRLAVSTVVHALDLPGFGGVPRRGQVMEVEALTEVIARALDRTGVGRAVVLGHSMGAQFAVELARTRPALVERAILGGPVVDPRRRSVAQQALDLLRDLVAESPSGNAIVISDYLRTRPDGFLAALRSMLTYPTERIVRQLTCPVLVLRGDRDPIARREWCEQLAAEARDGRFVEIPRAGHDVQHVRAQEVAALIRAFAEGRSVAG